LRAGHPDVLHWAAQAGLVYFLLHSLRWRDWEHHGAAVIRIGMALAWVGHTLAWAHDGVAFGQPFAVAAGVGLVWWCRGMVFQSWQPLVIPIAAGLVAVCHPLNLAVVQAQTTPVGVLAVVGSFALFAIGTAAALTKHRWHRAELPQDNSRAK